MTLISLISLKSLISFLFPLPSLLFNPAMRSFPPSHLGNSNKFDCPRFGVGCSFLLSHNNHHSGGGDALLAALKAEMLGGCRLERYAFDVEAGNLGHSLTHKVDVRA